MSTLLADVQALSLAWARVMPTLVLVPAFGLRALPVPARGVLGLALAACVAPAVVPLAHDDVGVPIFMRALEQIMLGLPIALSAAVPLWAATMAGGLADALRGAQDGTDFAVVEGSRVPPLGVVLSMLASLIFLSTGGPSRVVAALAASPLETPNALACAREITSGIGVAVALAAPLLASSIALDVASALITRSAAPANVATLIAPLRAAFLLALIALLFDRVTNAIALTLR